MKHIEKQIPAPAELDNFFAWVESKKDEFSTLSGAEQWDKLQKNHKEKLQNTILEEQGYICAYCNRRIHKGNPEDDEQLRIEHIEPKSIYPDKTFDYYNMVGVCYGDQREKERVKPPQSLHCDVKKGYYEIPKGLFPTNSDIEINVRYDAEGMMKSADDNINTAINDVLNLNCTKLLRARKNVLSPLVELVETKEEARKFINDYRTKKNGAFKPSAGVIISYLRNFFNL